MALFVALWFEYSLHKLCPLSIDDSGKIVSHVLVAAIGSVVARRRFPITKPHEHARSLKHIDIVVRTRYFKESMPNP